MEPFSTWAVHTWTGTGRRSWGHLGVFYWMLGQGLRSSSQKPVSVPRTVEKKERS